MVAAYLAYLAFPVSSYFARWARAAFSLAFLSPCFGVALGGESARWGRFAAQIAGLGPVDLLRASPRIFGSGLSDPSVFVWPGWRPGEG